MNGKMPPPETLWELLADIIGTSAGILFDPFNIAFVVACAWAGATYKRFWPSVLCIAGYAVVNFTIIHAMLYRSGAGGAPPYIPVYLISLGVIAFGIARVVQDARGKNNLPK